MQRLLRCRAWCLEAEGPLRTTLVASDSVGCGRELEEARVMRSAEP